MRDISIIIPYYKKKKFVRRTLTSISNQTYKNYEVIIVYDDEDLSEYYYIKKIIKNKKNFFIYKNQKNLGAGYSRNIGIKKSKGKFLAFLDADDYWSKKKLEKQIHFMRKNNYLITHTDYFINSKKNKNKKKIIRKSKNLNYSELLKSCDIGLSTVMIKKSYAINLRFPNLKTKEDFVYWLEFLKKNKCKIFSLNTPLTHWVDAKNSLSSSLTQKIKDAFSVYQVYCKFNFIKASIFVFILSFNAILKKIHD